MSCFEYDRMGPVPIQHREEFRELLVRWFNPHGENIYDKYRPLPSISGGRLLYPQPEDAPFRGDRDIFRYYLSLMSCAVASWSKVSCLGLALRNSRWFESQWGKKFSHEISVSVWDRCPPSIVMHLESYDRFLMKMLNPYVRNAEKNGWLLSTECCPIISDVVRRRKKSQGYEYVSEKSTLRDQTCQRTQDDDS
ncbi:hypothetical protein ANN_07835 [Periplaneta americana]|uniref:Uncharacterized protein n=1 Tax=Periplaneta americana TaxID=6978 RepID=A0ABQ8SZP6_PERAM|nr:hypothetical protein ANN_07835 [Periplaneta americana]